jgi:hypothetical protein
MPTAELLFAPDFRRVSQMRLFLSNLVLLVCDDRNLASRTSMAGAELVEFLTHHTQGNISFQAFWDPVKQGIRLVLGATVPLDLIADMQSAVEESRSMEPFAFYTKELGGKPSSEAPPFRLRLARILFEGLMIIRCEPSGTGVRITAESRDGGSTG